MSTWKHWLAAWACCGMLLSPAAPLVRGDEPAPAPSAAPAAEPDAKPAAPLDVSYIPASAAMAVVLHPQPLLTGPYADWMPVEVLTAAGMQQFGIDPVTIREAIILAAMPQNMREEPVAGFIERFSEP